MKAIRGEKVDLSKFENNILTNEEYYTILIPETHNEKLESGIEGIIISIIFEQQNKFTFEDILYAVLNSEYIYDDVSSEYINSKLQSLIDSNNLSFDGVYYKVINN